MKVRLKNQVGMVKESKIGFSWTTFFFGFFPAIFRGDWKWSLIQIAAAVFSFGVSGLVFCFIYNTLYINDLLSQGFTPASIEDESILISKGFITYDEE